VIRHLLKLVWARKRANALLILEIFFSFVVVFGVVTLAISMLMRWNRPLGFEYRDVWAAQVTFPPGALMDDKNDAPMRAVVETMLREVKAQPQVEWAAATGAAPFSNSSWTSSLKVNGRSVDITRDDVTDDFANVLHLPLLRGRWFSASDETTTAVPNIVIDADLANDLFGSLDVVGKTVRSGDDYVSRIIGVVAPYRKYGELSKDHVNMVFGRMSLTRKQGGIGRAILVRVRPGTPADFEATLIKRLHAVAPDFPVRVQHLDQMREFQNKIFIAPAIVGGVVASFLILMVALGLSGVLWQTVTRRTREIGLRRALGATGNEVNRQILLEVGLLATFALIVGVVVVAQLPLLGVFHLVSPASFSIGLAGALATIYGLTLLCGLYPSWLAGRVQPAQALHYE
jgi:putative ABC transport system permease protein